jgi:hypothetical protein
LGRAIFSLFNPLFLIACPKTIILFSHDCLFYLLCGLALLRVWAEEQKLIICWTAHPDLPQTAEGRGFLTFFKAKTRLLIEKQKRNHKTTYSPRYKFTRYLK